MRMTNNMMRRFFLLVMLIVCLFATSIEGTTGRWLRRLDDGDSPAEAPAEAPAESPAEAPAEAPNEGDGDDDDDDDDDDDGNRDPVDEDLAAAEELVTTTEDPNANGGTTEAATTPLPDTVTTNDPGTTQEPGNEGGDKMLGDPSPAPTVAANDGDGGNEGGEDAPTAAPAETAPEPTAATSTEPPQPTVSTSTEPPEPTGVPVSEPQPTGEAQTATTYEPTDFPVQEPAEYPPPTDTDDEFADWDTNYKPPTQHPVVYTPPGDEDDPVKQEPDEPASGAWIQEGESPEEMMHDRNVLIAAGVLCGIAVLLMIITAHQMVENPDGCCASICRLVFGCTCCIFRTICFPCRAICGGGSKRRSRQHEMINDNGNYSHDLELS